MLPHSWEDQGSMTKEVTIDGPRRIRRGLPNWGRGAGCGSALQLERALQPKVQK